MSEEFKKIFSLPGFKEKCDLYYSKYDPLAELCFDDDYALVLSDIKKRTYIKTVTDIGCAEGFQSEFFINEYDYIGINSGYVWGYTPSYNYLLMKSINGQASEDELLQKKQMEKEKKDCCRVPFFNEELESIKYYVAHFPEDLTEEMIGDCFIANMSVGYGELSDTDMEDVKSGFEKFDRGYANLTPEIHKILDAIFPYKKFLLTPRNHTRITFYTKHPEEI